jgi:hypothetical protein
LTPTEDLTTAAARRIGLIALLLLLGLIGATLIGAGVFADTASAAKCLDCEGEEEEPPGEEEELLAYTLTIHVSGIGAVKEGSTTYCQSSTAAGNTCEREVLEGEVVTLTATPGGGMTFTGWGGDCTVTAGACEVTMDEERSVTANFADQTPPAVPTITSPTSGQVLERTAEEPVEVVFNNSGDSSTVSYLCSLDLSFGGVPCSSPWQTGKLSAGSHTVYVWAKDAVGNVSSPASRGFEVVITSPEEEGGEGEGPPKEGGASPGNGGGTGSTTPGPVVVVDRVINPQPFVKWRLSGRKTIFRKLMLKGLPAGAKVAATCAGKGCPFKRRQVNAPQGIADLSKPFSGRKLAANVLVRLESSAAGYLGGPTIEVKTRAGKAPKVIKR